MDFISASDFKTYFKRDFPYLPYRVENKVYFKGDVIYVAPNFYISLVDNNTAEISDTTSWGYYNDSEENYLSDDDITKAIGEMSLAISDVFSEEDLAIVQYYLTAYYLVLDIKNAQAGLDSNAYASFVSSKSVGSVSESYGIPSWVNTDPMLSLYLDNGYGKKYLTYLIPRITGMFILSAGGVTE